jgi:hypothetical protein
MVRWCGEDGAGLFIAGKRRFGGRICAHRCSGEIEVAGRNLDFRGDGMARAGRWDSSGGDGMAQAEVVEGGISPRRPAVARQGGGRGGRSNVR